MLHSLTLVLMMFVAGGSAWAESEGISITVNAIGTYEAVNYNFSNENQNHAELWGGETHFIELSSEKTIVKVVMRCTSNYWSGEYSNFGQYIIENKDRGTFTTNGNDATWTGSETYLKFQSTGPDFDVYSITVWAEDLNPIDYTVTFVNAPAGAAATIEGNTYEGNDTFQIAKNLNATSVTNVVEPIGYQASVNYTAENHTFTITYSAIPAIKAGTEWTTMTLDTPFSLGDGYTPYIVKDIKDGVLDIEEVPAGYGVKVVDFDFEHNAVSYSGSNFVVDNIPNTLTATMTAGEYSGSIQGGYLFGYTDGGDYIDISVPDSYEGVIKYVEVVPYPGQGVKWKFDSGSYAEIAHYDANSKSVRISIGGTGYYYYIRHIVVAVEGPDAPIIPANTGVLVHGTTNTNIPYTLKAGATPSVVTSNLLVGCTEDATWNEAGKTYYKFSLNADNTVGSEGFYWGVEGGASIEAHAGKAYLVLDGTANVRGFRLDGKTEATEGIFNALNGEEEAGVVFNLNGQRMGNKLPAGVYVKNGRKYIVK